MRLASWYWGGQAQAGLMSACGRELTPLAVPHAVSGVLPLVRLLADGHPLPAPSGARLPTEVVTLRAPLARPVRSVFCVGRNYRAHAQELAGTVFRSHMNQADDWPIVFSKLPECVVAPREDVPLPGHNISTQIDYEGELAVIIGRGGRNIPRNRAMEHVLGYSIVNDVTARDVQMRHQQWDLGKSFDGFCPMGPCIVTSDELDGANLRVRTWVSRNGGNGPELRQDGRTQDLIFDIPTLVETCSRGISLLPGDVIATGTPAGVGMGMTPPCWLQHGDVVRVEIDGIGAIENRFVDHARRH